MFFGFYIIDHSKIDEIKSDQTLARSSKKYAIASIIFSLCAITLGILAIVFSTHPLSTTNFWLRFMFLSSASLLWGFSVSTSSLQLSINRNFFSIFALVLTIACALFLIVSLFV